VRAVFERYPVFEACPDSIEVAALVLSVAGPTDEQRRRLAGGIRTAIGKYGKREGARKKKRYTS